MSDQDQAKQIIDCLPEYKVSQILLFLRGVQFDDELEDDLFCEQLAESYLNTPDPHKHDSTTLEALAAREGITLYKQNTIHVDENTRKPGLNISVASAHSTQVALHNIRIGEAGLNPHRQSLLNRVPEIGDWAALRRDSIEIRDLAYLSAKTGHEFALLRGKNNDVLFHGTNRQCMFREPLTDLLVNRKFILVAHAHPGEEIPIPSNEDREALKYFGQHRSVVISGLTGITTDYGPDRFDILNSGI